MLTIRIAKKKFLKMNCRWKKNDFNELQWNNIQSLFRFSLLFQNFKNWNFHSLNLQFNIPLKILVKKCIQQVNKLNKKKKQETQNVCPSFKFYLLWKTKCGKIFLVYRFFFLFWFSLLLKFNTRSIFHLFYISMNWKAKKKSLFNFGWWNRNEKYIKRGINYLLLCYQFQIRKRSVLQRKSHKLINTRFLNTGMFVTFFLFVYLI